MAFCDLTMSCSTPDQAPFESRVSGDSVIAGVDYAYDDRVLTLVEHRLNERGGPVAYEVLNFGISGYGTEQEAALLEQVAGPFRRVHHPRVLHQ